MHDPDPAARRRAARKLFAIVGFAAGVLTVIILVRLWRRF
jgi:hypothetical protein